MTATSGTTGGLKNPFNIVVIVAALGYFVDIYDLILFVMVRVPSLRDIGIPDDKLTEYVEALISMQMYGMLLGGIVWGILGDKRGRLSVLFLTILMYSLANIANGFVTTYEQYYWLRFIAGFGLAGELGIGITLVSEVMTKETRGYGTSIVSGFGIAGAVLAYFIARLGWREAYWAGGVLGLMLLALRVYVHESGMFDKLKQSTVERGNFLSLFTNRKRFVKYLCCILIGLPVWYLIGILMAFSREIAADMNVNSVIDPKTSIVFHYIGATLGSFALGYLSERLYSRKKSLLAALVLLCFFCVMYFAAFNTTYQYFYLLTFLLGLTTGYWAVFVTVASEQFGTNIRSTVTTTVPNFVRGALPGMILLRNYFDKDLGMGMWKSAIWVGVIVVGLAFIGLFQLKETYGKDLDYHE